MECLVAVAGTVAGRATEGVGEAGGAEGTGGGAERAAAGTAASPAGAAAAAAVVSAFVGWPAARYRSVCLASWSSFWKRVLLDLCSLVKDTLLH